MNAGVLIFAINSTVNYFKAAEVAARQAKKYLNLPVTLVTNAPIKSDVFDTIIPIVDKSSTTRSFAGLDGKVITMKWFNESKVRAYELSPYQKTLLIDADFFMYNSSLLPLFNTNIEMACYNEINDISGEQSSQVRIGKSSIPMQWATVLYFEKCPFSNSVFEFMLTIKNNWDYYALLYGFNNKNFRNDYALSIALQTLSGYSIHNYCKIPGKLHTIFANTAIKSVRNNEILYFQDHRLNKILNTNIHCINKTDLPKFYATH